MPVIVQSARRDPWLHRSSGPTAARRRQLLATEAKQRALPRRGNRRGRVRLTNTPHRGGTGPVWEAPGPGRSLSAASRSAVYAATRTIPTHCHCRCRRRCRCRPRRSPPVPTRRPLRTRRHRTSCRSPCGHLGAGPAAAATVHTLRPLRFQIDAAFPAPAAAQVPPGHRSPGADWRGALRPGRRMKTASHAADVLDVHVVRRAPSLRDRLTREHLDVLHRSQCLSRWSRAAMPLLMTVAEPGAIGGLRSPDR